MLSVNNMEAFIMERFEVSEEIRPAISTMGFEVVSNAGEPGAIRPCFLRPELGRKQGWVLDPTAEPIESAGAPATAVFLLDPPVHVAKGDTVSLHVTLSRSLRFLASGIGAPG